MIKFYEAYYIDFYNETISLGFFENIEQAEEVIQKAGYDCSGRTREITVQRRVNDR